MSSVLLFRFVQPCGLMREQTRQPFEFPPVVTMVNKANKGKRARGGTFVPCELDQSSCFLVFGCRWFTRRESPWSPSWSSCGPWPRRDGQGAGREGDPRGPAGVAESKRMGSDSVNESNVLKLKLVFFL